VEALPSSGRVHVQKQEGGMWVGRDGAEHERWENVGRAARPCREGARRACLRPVVLSLAVCAGTHGHMLAVMPAHAATTWQSGSTSVLT